MAVGSTSVAVILIVRPMSAIATVTQDVDVNASPQVVTKIKDIIDLLL